MDVEADDWGELFFRIVTDTGWTYRDVGELTFPQLFSWLNKGADPKPRIADPAEIKALVARYAEMNRGQAC